MDIKKFETLEKEFELNSYGKRNLFIKNVLYYGSYLPNILLIFAGFIFINEKIETFTKIFPFQYIVFSLITFGILIAIELSKRELTYRTTVDFLKNKNKFSAIPLLIFTLILNSFSYFASVHGGQKISDIKKEIITSNSFLLESKVNKVDSLYNIKINNLQSKIDYIFDYSKTQNKKPSNNDLKNIKEWELQINNLNQQKNKEINELKNTLKNKEVEQLDENDKNLKFFLILFASLELFIIFSLAFKGYYNYKVWSEGKEFIKRNPSYQKYKEYKEMLRILYNNGEKTISDILPTINEFNTIIKIKNQSIKEKDIFNFLSLLNNLKITEIESKTRKARVEYDEALKILTKYFGFEE